MKLIAKYLKPFALLLLLCFALLFGQAMCDLSLPNLMSDIVNVGIQQGGVEEGAPEALSANGLALLQAVAEEGDKALLQEGYNVFEPQSSESHRFEEKYPLAREEPICVQTEALSPEGRETLDAAYSRSAYTFLLYMQQAQESGELERLAQGAALGSQAAHREPGYNLKTLDEIKAEAEESSLPEGVLGEIPGDAVFTMPEEDGPNGEGDHAEGFPSEDGESSALSGQPAGEHTEEEQGFDMAEGLDNADIQQLYQLLPLLQALPRESLKEAQDAAQAGASSMGEQVGITLKRVFYRELGMDVDAIRFSYIWRIGLKMLGVALLGAAATVLVGLFASRIGAAVAKRLRHDVFAKVESFSNTEFDRFSTASLITRTTNDVQQVQMLIVMGIRMVCYAPIIGIGGIIFAVGKSVSMSWIVAAAVVVMIGLICVGMSLALPKFKALQKLIDRLNLVSRENLSGMMVVRAFGNESYEEERFDRANRDLAGTTRYVQRVMSLMMPAMMFIMNLASLVIVWVGGHAIADSTLQIGDMMAFIQYAMQIISAFLMIAMMFIMVPRASVSAVRIQEVLDTQPEIRDAEAPESLPQVKGVVEFKDVSFRHQNAESNALEHISFTARPGETTAFIGATGSGKSTLINLIPRFYDVTSGEICIDGVDIRRLPQKELREAIGYVPQKGILFSGTIDSNIRYGKEDAQAQEISEAIQVAQAEEFVSKLKEDEEGPGGVGYPISQGGANVSGGQRQRLSIARALVRKAPVYIFDDSFSALDFKTDAALRKALKQYTASSTVLIVAQRVSTIMHAEQIIVLEGGKMVGKGTHRELLENCPEYREIAESQLQKEELQ